MPLVNECVTCPFRDEPINRETRLALVSRGGKRRQAFRVSNRQLNYFTAQWVAAARTSTEQGFSAGSLCGLVRIRTGVARTSREVVSERMSSFRPPRRCQFDQSSSPPGRQSPPVGWTCQSEWVKRFSLSLCACQLISRVRIGQI